MSTESPTVSSKGIPPSPDPHREMEEKKMEKSNKVVDSPSIILKPRAATPPQLQQKSAIPTISPPAIGMYVDRSSFDETDCYNVNEDAVQATQWSREQNQWDPARDQIIVMKNGKIKRRLRWRPKALMKKRRPRPGPGDPSPRSSSQQKRLVMPDGLPSGAKKNSSNSSVASQSSRSSKRSLHSFASTETKVKSNTKSSKRERRVFPLPRPNYSTSLDVPQTNGRARSTITSSLPDGEMKGIVEKVSEEGRIEEDGVKGTNNAGLSQNKLPPSGRSTPVRRHHLPAPMVEEKKEDDISQKIPPRLPFRPDLRTRCNSMTTYETSRGTKSQSQMIRQTMSSSPKTIQRAFLKTADQMAVPSLSGDLFEQERRVDLRIRRPGSDGCDGSLATTTRLLNAEEFRAIISVNELQSTDETESSKQSAESQTSQRNPGLPCVASNVEGGVHKVDEQEKHVKDILDDLASEEGQITEEEINEDDHALVEASDEEIRFCMEPPATDLVTVHDDIARNAPPIFSPVSQTESTTSSRSVPVDLDDCSFLEAEKNLKAIHNMATLHLQQGEYDEALEVFEEILRGQVARYGKEHHRVGTALHNIGIVHIKRGDYEQATPAYREAIKVRKKALGPDHADVAASLAQLGVAYLERRLYKRAVNAFREALRIRRKVYGSFHPKIAKILNNIGCALYELNALDVARVAFEEALDVQRQCLRNTPDPEESDYNFALLSIASTLSNIASIKLYSNDFDEASQDFQEALLLQQCVFGDDHPVPIHTADSLRWIEEARGRVELQAESSSPRTGLVSKIISMGSITNGPKSLLDCASPTDVEALANYSSTFRESGTFPALDIGDDGVVAIEESRTPKQELFDSMERRFSAFHVNLDFACGPDEDTEDDQTGFYSI